MCGLVGMITPTAASDKHMRLLSNLLYVDQIRGEHATGVAKVDVLKNTVAIHKKAVSAQKFLALEETEQFLSQDRGRIYIGHNRWATIGAKDDDDNAHPFQEDHITLVHNGSVDRWTMDKLEGYDDKDINVDSHMVCKTIADLGFEAALPKLSGAFALIWWDTNTRSLNMVRNIERPLYIAQLVEGTVIWASEARFLDFFVEHPKSTMAYAVNRKPEMLPVDKLFTWEFNQYGVLQNGGKPKVAPVNFTKVPDPDPISDYSGWFGNMGRQTFYPQTRQERSEKASITADGKWESRVAKICNEWMLDIKLGGTIGITLISWRKAQMVGRAEATFGYSCNGVAFEVKAYNVEVTKLQGGSEYKAAVTNVFTSRRVPYGENKSIEEVTIVIDPSTLLRALELRPANKTVLSVINNSPFPIKVQGHTFQTKDEFITFVAKGCSCCDKVPTPYNYLNHKMVVVEGRSFTGLLDQCDFICGSCIQQDEDLSNVANK